MRSLLPAVGMTFRVASAVFRPTVPGATLGLVSSGASVSCSLGFSGSFFSSEPLADSSPSFISASSALASPFSSSAFISVSFDSSSADMARNKAEGVP